MNKLFPPYLEWEILREPVTISKVEDTSELPKGKKKISINRDEEYKLYAIDHTGELIGKTINVKFKHDKHSNELSFEGKRILKKIEDLGKCNLYVLRTSLGVTANHCLNHIRGELAPYIEKDFKQMYQLKKK